MIRLADMLGMDSFLRAVSAELHIACVGIRPCNFRFVRLSCFVLLCRHPTVVSSFLSFCVGIRSRRSLTTCIAGVGIRPHRSWRKNQIRRMGTFNPCLIVYYCSVSFIFLILLVSVSDHVIFALFVSFVSSCCVGIRPCRSSFALSSCIAYVGIRPRSAGH